MHFSTYELSRSMALASTWTHITWSYIRRCYSSVLTSRSQEEHDGHDDVADGEYEDGDGAGDPVEKVPWICGEDEADAGGVHAVAEDGGLAATSATNARPWRIRRDGSSSASTAAADWTTAQQRIPSQRAAFSAATASVRSTHRRTMEDCTSTSRN